MRPYQRLRLANIPVAMLRRRRRARWGHALLDLAFWIVAGFVVIQALDIVLRG